MHLRACDDKSKSPRSKLAPALSNISIDAWMEWYDAAFAHYFQTERGASWGSTYGIQKGKHVLDNYYGKMAQKYHLMQSRKLDIFSVIEFSHLHSSRSVKDNTDS